MKNLLTSAMVLLFSLPVFAAGKGKTLPADDNRQTVKHGDLEWFGDLAPALERAAKEKKHVFIDFTGVTCTNCKLNEKTVFIKPEVKELFAKYICVQLYSDTIPPAFYKKPPDMDQREKDAEAIAAFQKKTFNTEQLPLYVVVKPDGDMFLIVSVYGEGKINNVNQFLEFLKKPLKGE